MNHPERSTCPHDEWLKKKFGIKERTANSIVRTIAGRRAALMELKKTELSSLKEKLKKKKEKYKKRIKKLNALKKKAARNKLSEEELVSYRKEKTALHEMKQSIGRMETKKKKLEKTIKSGKLSLCFGTKKLFKAQYFLKENGFKNHKQWRQAFRRARDRMMAYIPRSEETFGNQQCHLEMTDKPNTYILSVLPGKSAGPKKKDKAIQGTVKFNYRPNSGETRSHYLEELDRELLRHKNKSFDKKPLTGKIIRRGFAWYVQISFKMDSVPWSTESSHGNIGLDFNKEFIQACETDESGNIVGFKRFDLPNQSKNSRGQHEILEKVKEIVSWARSAGKDIAYEDLDFIKTKSAVLKASSRKGKDYNRMVHSLNYSQYKEGLQRRCFKEGVTAVAVNPAYTSKNAKPYCRERKMNIHSGAAWLIAQRARGFRSQQIDALCKIKSILQLYYRILVDLPDDIVVWILLNFDPPVLYSRFFSKR